MTAVLRLLALVLAALLCVPGAAPLGIAPALAQQPADAAPDFEAWERTATRAEEAVEAARASTPALEVLRAELVKWRQQFQQAQSINAAAIATVERQIAALGPAPAEGTTEAEDIAAQRTQLNERLVQLHDDRRVPCNSNAPRVSDDASMVLAQRSMCEGPFSECECTGRGGSWPCT